MSLDTASERVCYVHCNFCNTILVVTVPCSTSTILFNTVTVGCGRCANLLSLNTGALLQNAHLQNVHVRLIKKIISSDRMSEEIRRIKVKNPEISHREAFSSAAKNWAHLPRTRFGLTLINDTNMNA
ncbi:unnamed protein product [Dovyalis caffra]|uniref:YABBY2 n=1 Tax=Dovyalis caffra TaxID=77055 RepID=A0AAV1RZQ2_9ROSI|nr:unnamed protein product [Dovyalis caffra]